MYRINKLSRLDRKIYHTKFANKLVAVTDRYEMHQTIAGRDIYDIHNFFIHGYSYHAPVIQERIGLTPKDYFGKLIDFIKEHVNQTIINEDLNALLPANQFQQIRKILLTETLSLLTMEQKRLEN